MATATTDPDQRKIMQLYAAYGAALVLSVVPFVLAAFISAGLFMGVLIAAYILRTGTEHGSLIENHMTFVIHTIWIGSFLALLTMTGASIYLFNTLDNTPLDPCINQFLAIGSSTQVIELQAMLGVFQGCFESYVNANFKTFIISALIAAGPVLLYFIVRYARGFSRAASGYRISHPESWL